MAHANARTNLFARRLMVERVAAGWPAAHVAEQLGVSRATVHKWLRRHAEGGDAALSDRSSRPIRMPQRTSRTVEKRVLAARQRRKRGAVVLAADLGLNPSTVGRILARHQVPHLAVIDPITGERIRASRRSDNRYEHRRPGDMIHVDVKKLGRVPDGGGWRYVGRTQGNRNRAATPNKAKNKYRGVLIGTCYLHTVIDDHSRVAYVEARDDETKETATEVLRNAVAWFAERGVTIHRVLSDNGSCYKSYLWHETCTELGITVKKTRPYRPQTNGKIERFHRTLVEGWAFKKFYNSESARLAALPAWLHEYNHHRPHSAIGKCSPISRLDNLAGHHS